MPGSNYVSNGVVAGASAVFAQSSSGGWLQAAATGYSDRYNLNCFIVMVSAPDINSGSCHKLVPSISALPADQIVLKYGMIAGAVPAGKVLDMEMVPGSSRVFSVYGMHSDSVIACSLFSTGLFNRSTMTKPYYVGQSLPQQLSGGVSNSVSIIGQPFDSSKYIDYCDTETALGGTPQILTPGALQVKFDTNVSGSFDALGSCIPVDVGFKDTTGLQAVSTGYAGSIILQKPSSTTLQTYASVYECMNSINALSSFSLGEFSARRYVKPIDIYGASSLNIMGSPTLTSTELFPGMPSVIGAVNDVLLTSFPEIIHNGECYLIQFSLNKTDHSGSGLFSATGSWSATAGFSRVGATANFFSDDTCSTYVSATSAGGPYYLNKAYAKTYVKFGGLIDGDKVAMNISLSSPTVANYFFGRAKGNNGSSAPVKLKIQGPSEFPFAVGCYGPFRLSAADQFGGEVASDSRQIQLSINADQLAVYANVPPNSDPCSGTGSSLVTTAAPATVTLTTSQVFYVKLFNNTSYSLTQYVYATDLSATNKLTPTNFQLNITNSNAAAIPPQREPPAPFYFCKLCALP